MRIFKILWTLDDWGHRHLGPAVHRVLLGRVCDWLDDELCKPVTTFHRDRSL